MPAIFHRVNGKWCAERLATKHAVLSFAPMRFAAPEAASSCVADDTIELMRLEPSRKWIAIIPAGSQITHNAQPAAGLRVLAHGDLLAAAHGAAVFFSTEQAPSIETFGQTQSVSCPRCKRPIVLGQSVVRCPACGVVHHELADPDRNCWTYAEKCALCPQPTALDLGLRWSPEAL
jgi:hypothetical protein